MKKLNNINIDRLNSQLSFQVTLAAEITESEFMVFVDECDNVNNIYGDQSDDHSYYFSKYNSDITIEQLSDDQYNITIQNIIIKDMNDNLKYIKVIGNKDNYIVEGIYYNSTVIYNAELVHIKKVCNTCLDDRTMQLLMHVVFKRQLLESALEFDDYKQCMMLYLDLCRLLEIDVNYSCANCSTCSECVACCGGCCSIK